jgi:alpha-ketoglutaric semialdehyde dehydrogenase
MGPQINQQQIETTRKYVDIGKSEGAKLLSGGNQITSRGLGDGYFFEPTIFGDAHGKMRVAQEEIFGPVVSVIPTDSLEQAVEISNGVAYGLSSAVYTRDVNRAFKAMRDLQTGITYINAPTIGAEVHLPFGGTKATGNGHREGGIGAIDFYTQWKAIYVDYSDRLQRAQIDTGE